MYAYCTKCMGRRYRWIFLNLLGLMYFFGNVTSTVTIAAFNGSGFV